MIQDNEQKLDAAIEHMLALEPAYEMALKGEAETEFNFEQAFASKMLGTSATNDQKRKAEATEATKSEQNAYLKARSAVKFLAVRMKNAQTAVSARQSILSNEKNRNF